MHDLFEWFPSAPLATGLFADTDTCKWAINLIYSPRATRSAIAVPFWWRSSPLQSQSWTKLQRNRWN